MSIREEPERCGYSKEFTILAAISVSQSLRKVSVSSEHTQFNALKMHLLHFGVSKEMQTDFGTNFSAAKETLEAEQIMDEDIKRIYQALKSNGISLIQRSPKAPFIQVGIERSNFIGEGLQKKSLFSWNFPWGGGGKRRGS